MDGEVAFTVGLWLGSVLLIIWCGWISFKLNGFTDDLGGFEESFSDIEQGLAIIGNVLQQIPEMMPNFHLPQENPLQTIINLWLQNVNKSNDNITKPVRDDEGRFTNGALKEENDSEKTD
jgi:hypothetical protein